MTGYRATDIEAFVETHVPGAPIQFIHNARFAETNNIFSMALAFDQMPLDDDLLLVESDLVFDPHVIGRLIDNAHPNVALVDHYRTGMDGTVVSRQAGMISQVFPPHLQGLDFDFKDKYKTLNIYKFSAAFCSTTFRNLLDHYARVIDDNSYYELVLGILIYIQREVIHAELLEGETWAELDDPNDLDVARFKLDEASKKTLLNQAFGGFWNFDVLDFSFIRNMYFPSPAVISELRNNLQVLLENYGSRQSILNRKLSFFLLCPEERLSVLNGASQAYLLLQRQFASHDVLIPQPTFGEYARMFPKATTYPDKGSLQLNQIEAMLAPEQLVVIVNPNNPTGTTLDSQAIAELVRRHPDTSFLVNESFIEFSAQRSLRTLLGHQELDNVIIIASLSKSLGVPGLRLGYLYSSNLGIIQSINDNLPIWNLNSLAENYLEIILKHRQIIEASYNDTVRDREVLSAELKSLPRVAQVYDSGANFLLVRFDFTPAQSADLLDNMLVRHHLFLKDVSDRFYDPYAYIRFAVRTPVDNARLIAALRPNLEELI